MITYPWNTENFKEQWKLWKQYKKEEHRFRFKSKISEQASLRKLSKIAKTEIEAINIMHEAMANGWKGLFETKTNNNGRYKKMDAEKLFGDLR